MSKQPDTDKLDYRHRHYGQAGGYNQTGPSLAGNDEAPPRVPPSPEGGGGHLGAYEASHWGGRSEHEPTEELDGEHSRFSDDAIPTDDSAFGGSEDAPLARAVQQVLAEADDLDATAVSVAAHGTGVLITGAVDSPEASQRAEALARSIDGVGAVTNQLQIVRSENLGEIPRPVPPRH